MDLRSVTVDVGDPRPGVLRRPWRQWGLAVVTVGVYAVVHHYRLNRELRDFGVDVDPVRACLAFVPGVVLVVPWLVTLVRTGRRIAVAQETVGLTVSIRPWVCVPACVLGLVHVAYAQAEVNRAWRADLAGGLA
jgi:hypothetical protein